MSAISPAAQRLVAVRRAARDAAWKTSAASACKEALRAGRFADAEALADAVGAELRREGDLARVGLRRPLAADAHPEAVRAARALAGPAPALVAGRKASDPVRRALELYWELLEGRHQEALSRRPRRLPTGDERVWWQGVLLLLEGEEEAAAQALVDAPGEGGRWAREAWHDTEPSRPAGKYARALQDRDRCLAGQLFRPEFVADADAGRVAAMMVVCETHRADAERHAAAIADPFTRALWKVRKGLVEAGPGWEAVAVAAPAAGGVRAAAAPLAWLRAADAWRKDGDARRVANALAQAGPRAAAFPAELEAARQPVLSFPGVEELARMMRDAGLAAALQAVGQGAPADLVSGVLSFLELRVEEAPHLLPAALAGLEGPLEPALWAAVVERAFPVCGVPLLARALAASPGWDGIYIAGVVIGRTEPPEAVILQIALGAGLVNPGVLAVCAHKLGLEALERVSEAIDARGGALADELRIAMAEGVEDRRRGLPNGMLLGITRRGGPWADYAASLRQGTPPRPTPGSDPRIAPALRENRGVFSPPRSVLSAFRERLQAFDEATDELNDAMDEAFVEAGQGAPRPLSDAERKKKAAARKAQKKARKAGRKRR